MHYKQIFLTVFTITIGLALTAYTAYGANPEVTNVQASQRTDGSMLVDISYDLEDADGDAVTISINVSDNDGLSYDVNVTSITGDAGEGITPRTGKSIVWNAGTDVPGVYGTEYRVKVLADDGKGDESTAGYKASVVLSKALKYAAFSSKNSTFKSSSVGGNISGQSIVVKIVDKVVKTLDRVFQTKPKQKLNATYPNYTPYGTRYPRHSPYGTGYPGHTPYGTGYPYRTPYGTRSPKPTSYPNYTPYNTGYPRHTPYGTGYPGYTPYGTGYPYHTPYGTRSPKPTPYPTGESSPGMEGFTYNGDGTFTRTPAEGVTATISFYKSDGTQITVNIFDHTNYLAGGALYGEQISTFFSQSQSTVSVQRSSVTVNMHMASEKSQMIIGSCPEEVIMSGSGTFEFKDIGTGEATITVTIKECGDNMTGHTDISITVDGTDCVISRDFNKDGCQGGPITCGGVQIGEVTRGEDGNLYYCEPDCSTGEKTLIDESVTFGSGS